MKRVYWGIAVAIAIITAGAVVYFITKNDERPPESQAPQTTEAQPEPQQSTYTAPDLQPIIDTWTAKYNADYSIAVYDFQSNTVVAQHDPDKVLFAASMYKLYIAYLSLLDFQTGTQNPDEIITGGQTKKICVDKMIRESDSPCGEAMMADIGPANLNSRVNALGITNTTFNGIQTTSSDLVKILVLIQKSEDLNQDNRAFLLNALQDQPDRYERGLKRGAPAATWYTKVGWNLDINYHDAGIMKLPDGRYFAVSIMGQGSGASAPITDFATTIYNELTK